MCLLRSNYWRKTQRDLVSKVLGRFSRGAAYECWLPPTRSVARTRLTENTVPLQVTDPFTVKFLPPKNQLLKWKEGIARKNQFMNGRFVYAENVQGCFDIPSLQTMLKLNSAKSIKTAVQKEIKWFVAPYDIPGTVHQPPASSIEKFKDLLYSVRYDKLISAYDMSPNELSTICLNRWLSCDPIRWLMKSLNGSQSHTYCVYLNEFRGDPSSLNCSVNGSTKPEKFLFDNTHGAIIYAYVRLMLCGGQNLNVFFKPTRIHLNLIVTSNQKHFLWGNLI